jgi:hypothetical protein
LLEGGRASFCPPEKNHPVVTIFSQLNVIIFIALNPTYTPQELAMSTRQDFHLSAPPSAVSAVNARWQRVMTALRTAAQAVGLRWARKSPLSPVTPAGFASTSLPPAGRVAALSSAGMQTLPPRNVRRPGVRGHWKGIDRVTSM